MKLGIFSFFFIFQNFKFSEYYGRLEDYAMDRYMYVLCFKCNKAYFGGESRCQVVSEEFFFSFFLNLETIFDFKGIFLADSSYTTSLVKFDIHSWDSSKHIQEY